MAANKATAVATKKGAQLPAEFLEELADDGEQYQESLSKDDMSIPFLQILQSLSPQCTKGEPEFIKGAEPSDLMDTVTQSIIKTRDDDNNPIVGCQILPVHYKRSFIEWVPRKQGGGLVREWTVAQGLEIITERSEETGADIIQEGSPLGTPGNQLNDTHTHFVFLIKDDSTWEPVIMTMASTQIKPSKDLNNMVSKHVLPNGAKAARFFGIYNVTTQYRSNDAGSWYVWKFERASDVVKAKAGNMYHEAKKFVEGIQAGEHKADHAKAAVGEVNPSTSGAKGTVKDDVPF